MSLKAAAIVGRGRGLLPRMTVLMMAPGLVGSHVYPTGNSVRLLVAHLFVTLVAWSYEQSRERVHALLATTNEQLQLDKERLKDSLGQISTLRGLLPATLSDATYPLSGGRTANSPPVAAARSLSEGGRLPRHEPRAAPSLRIGQGVGQPDSA